MGKTFIFSILIFFSFIACSSDPIIVESIKEEEEQIEQVLEPTLIQIDSTDLKILPPDSGGKHTAFPLGTTNAVFGHYVYTPGGYDESDSAYPLLIFLHGWDPSGYTGTDSSELDELLFGTTPPGLIKNGRWNPSFPFVVASPRLKFFPYWNHNQIHDFIEYIISNYNINTKRIYLTGLSLGGGGTWYYVGERGDNHYVAAIVPISAGGEERIVSNLTNIPIWAFHGSNDAIVLAHQDYGSLPLVNAINALNPSLNAKVTIFNGTGHDAWSWVYSNQFTTNTLNDLFDVSIYDWLLQYKKD